MAPPVGFPDVPEGAAVFSDVDVEAARQLLGSRLAEGSDFGTLLRQVRVVSVSMARIASVLADYFGDLVLDLRGRPRRRGGRHRAREHLRG